MARPFERLRRFLRELKRRKVYRVAAVYAGVAFVTLQVARLIFPATTLEGVYDALVVIAFVGFPIALVLAWAFEVTPEGVRRTPDVEPGPERSAGGGAGARTGYRALVGLGLVAAAVAGGWYLVGSGGDPADSAPLGERSVAVLPFESLGRAEPGTFTEGMHDDLLARLSNVSDLRVISRTAVQQYRGTDKTTGEIARELGVRWVLEGAVQRMEDRIQVNAQLIDPRTETHAWVETYQRDLTARDLFDLQAEITRRIARSLETQLTPDETGRVERRPTDDLEAYRLYVEGRSHLDERTEAGMRQSVGYFRRAIDRDSTYALAWSGLADAWSLLAAYRYGAADTLYPRAEEAAQRALEIEPRLAEAHASLARIIEGRDRNGPAALRELRVALELKPSYARSHHWLGILLMTLGRPEEGVRRLERAAELDPMSAPIHVALAGAYMHLGRFEEALPRARRAEQLAPGYVSGPLFLGVARLAVGRPREAMEALRRARDLARSGTVVSSGTEAWLAVAHHRAGDTTRARDLLAEIEETGGPYPAALVHAELGHVDAAISALRRADYFYVAVEDLRYSQVFDPLRGDPRFQQILRRVNREWGLNPDGSLPDSVDVPLPPAD